MRLGFFVCVAALVQSKMSAPVQETESDFVSCIYLYVAFFYGHTAICTRVLSELFDRAKGGEAGVFVQNVDLAEIAFSQEFELIG